MTSTTLRESWGVTALASARRWMVLCAVGFLSVPAAATDAQDTAAIAGVVLVSGEPAGPVRHAIVLLSESMRGVTITGVTDDAGRFSFDKLSSGRYIVTAQKPAYLAASHGATRPGAAGTPIVLAAGQRIDDVRLTLVRGAVIAGHVRDASGAPAPNIPVIVAPAHTAFRPDTYVPRPGGIMTDARGAYRAYNLAPGDYVIAAAVGDVSNRAVVFRPTAAEIDASLLALHQETSGGSISAASLPSPAAPKIRSYSWAPVFYPGTTSAYNAMRVRVTVGDIREDLDFAVDLGSHATLQGVVVTPDGSPARVTTSISNVGPPGRRATAAGSVISLWSTAVMGSTNQFNFRDLTPGLYLLSAKGEQSAWAAANVLVGDADIRDVKLVLQPPLSFSGRLVFDGTLPARSVDPASWTIALHSLDVPDRGAPLQAGGLTTVNVIGLPAPNPVTPGADGTFSFGQILAGTYTLAVGGRANSAESGGWWLASALAGGRDLLDQPLEFGGTLQTVTDAVLTLTDRRTELVGRLQTASGQPATGFFVIAFSADRAHWFPGARRTRLARPAADGGFTVPELPAGAYLVAAVTDAVTDEYQRASFLEQLASFAVPVTVRTGETTRQDLQMAR